MVFRSLARRGSSACAAVALTLAGSSAAVLPAQASASPAGPPVDVIVRQVAGAGQLAESAVEELGGHVGRHLGIIDGFSARVPSDRLPELSATPGVLSVTRDASLRLQADAWKADTDLGSLRNVAEATGAAQAWDTGLTGKGVDVAIIDSGVARVAGLQ